jgi:Putative zinc-finger
MSCTHTVALGAYLLGSLDPAERSAFERHLNGCPTCRREMIRLAPLPGLLSQVRLEDIELPFEDPAPDPDLIPLPPRPEPAPKPRPRWPLLAGAAALIAVLVVTGLTVPKLFGDPDPVTWQADDAGTGVSATADLVAKSWGTELWMTIQHIPKGRRCKLVVRNRDGNSEVGGWWATDHPEDERIPGSTSFPVDQIERLDVMVGQDVLVSVRP